MTHAPKRSAVWAAALAVSLLPASAGAADITVANGADSGAGSLRQAIADARAGDRIVFASQVTEVRLSSEELVVDKDLTIAGPGAARLRIVRAPGAPSFRILRVQSPTGNFGVTLSGLTISGGEAPHDLGSGIRVRGVLGQGVRLTLRECEISGNRAAVGSGVSMSLGTLELIDTTVTGNHNTGAVEGGAVVMFGVRATIVGSTISGNTGSGGIYASGSDVDVSASTISNNQHLEYWGRGSALVAENSSNVLLESTTVVANGDTPIALIQPQNSPVTVRLRNSIVQAPPGVATVFADVTASLVSLGHNLFSDSPAIADDSDVSGAEARLGPLAFNGGPTRTHALLTDSPAIDRADCSDSAGRPLARDQRGQPRPVDHCDIGAFEAADEHAPVLEALASVEKRLGRAVGLVASQASVSSVQQTLDVLVQSGLASQASVDALHAALSRLTAPGPGPERLASQASVDAVGAAAQQANSSLGANLDDRVSSRASQASIEDMRAALARESIERQLADGRPLARHVLPAALGGQIESVRDLLQDIAERMRSAGLSLGSFESQMRKADAVLGRRHYRLAWHEYSDIYRSLVRRDPRDR